MAKFQPGNKLSTGRPVKLPAAKPLIELNKNDVLHHIANALCQPVGGLEAMLKRNDFPAIKMAALRLAYMAANGDMTAFDFLLNRLIGKVKETVDLTANIELTERKEQVDRIIDIVPRDKLIELIKLKQGDAGDE